jgi:hypothetical protein
MVCKTAPFALAAASLSVGQPPPRFGRLTEPTRFHVQMALVNPLLNGLGSIGMEPLVMPGDVQGGPSRHGSIQDVIDGGVLIGGPRSSERMMTTLARRDGPSFLFARPVLGSAALRPFGYVPSAWRSCRTARLACVQIAVCLPGRWLGRRPPLRC